MKKFFVFALFTLFILPHFSFAQVVNVSVIKVSAQKSNRTAVYVGNAESFQATSLSSKKEGELEKLSAEEGKTYRKNTVLAIIENSLSVIAINQAKLAVEQALNDIVLQENNLQNLVNTYLYEEYSYDITVKEFEREKTLFERNMSSQASLDNASKKMKADGLKLNQSRLLLEGVVPKSFTPVFSKQISNQLNKKVSPEKIKLEGQIDYSPLNKAIIAFENSKQNLDKARIDYQEHLVLAPFKGVLLKKNSVEVGKYVRKGDALFEFGDISKIKVEVNINQEDLSQIKVGMKAKLVFDALPGKTYEGVLSSVAQQGSQNSRTFPVKITVQNRDGLIKPAYSVRVNIEFEDKNEEIIIPSYALILSSEGAYVYKVKNDVAQKTSVIVGKNYGQNVQIISGISSGDVIVTKGQAYLKDNNPVNITLN